MKRLKYLEGLPWLDIVGEQWVNDFESSMDEWLKMLEPIHDILRNLDVVYCNFAEDRPSEVDNREYVVSPDYRPRDIFTYCGIIFLVDWADDPKTGIISPLDVHVNSVKDRYAFSWRDFFKARTDCDELQLGEILLLPYFDAYISTFPLYSSIMNNINTEFRQMIGDNDVEIVIDGSRYLMTRRSYFDKTWLQDLP